MWPLNCFETEAWSALRAIEWQSPNGIRLNRLGVQLQGFATSLGDLAIVRVLITIRTHHAGSPVVPIHHAVRSAAPTVFKPTVFFSHAAAIHPMWSQNVCKKRESVFLCVAETLIKWGARIGELF